MVLEAKVTFQPTFHQFWKLLSRRVNDLLSVVPHAVMECTRIDFQSVPFSHVSTHARFGRHNRVKAAPILVILEIAVAFVSIIKDLNFDATAFAVMIAILGNTDINARVAVRFQQVLQPQIEVFVGLVEP